MKFNTKDTEIVTTSYLNFLQNLKNFILENDLRKVEKITPVIHYLLENGHFTEQPKMILTHQLDFLYPQSNIELGVQVMYGSYCCRHANTLFKNLLQQLEYQNVRIAFFLIGEHGTWKKLKNGHGANHLTASIFQNGEEIFLDAYNGYTFKTNKNSDVILLDEPLTLEEKQICDSYNDQENIKNISKVLKKYYHLRSLGINHIYDEEIYGIG